jgi:neutral ceramidase
LLNTGDVAKPYEWDPRIVPIQILRVGNVFILAVPSEFTTMAGRRLRKAVKQILTDGNIVERDQEVFVTIAGLSNTYASYVTTYEEYQAQRYEAASCIFGPHALDAYIQEFSRLARDLVSGVTSESTVTPPDLTDEQIQLITEPRFDRLPLGVKFGDVVTDKDVKSTYTAGQVAQVTFHAANPRNNQRVQGSYVSVEKQLDLKDGNGITLYKTVAYDGDWSTKFDWRAGPEDPLDLGVSKQSIATISWEIDSTVEEGTYRICYHGDHKVAVKATMVPFIGCSSDFTVTAAAGKK